MSTWESDKGESYLTAKGKQALDNYALRQDLFRTYNMMQLYQEDLKNLKKRDIVYGPRFNNANSRYNLFQLTDKCEFIKINNNDITNDNVKLIRSDLKIYNGSWFSCENKLFFASSILGKIEKLSIYYTPSGLNYLLTKRQNYLYVRDNPHLFGENQVKAFKTIPKTSEWW